MGKKWKPRVSGILLIIIGAGIPLCSVVFTILCAIPPAAYAQTVVLTIPLIIIAVWILPLYGGINALRRKNWRSALVGCIAGFFYILLPSLFLRTASVWTKWGNAQDSALTVSFYVLLLIPLLAIPTLVLIIMSKNEFE